MRLDRLRTIGIYLSDEGQLIMEVERLSDHTQHIFQIGAINITNLFQHNRELSEEMKILKKKK